MRIGFDVRPLLKQETGVGIYLRNLLSHLSVIDRENEYYLFSTSLKDRLSPKKMPEFEKGDFREFRFPVRVIDYAWHHWGWPKMDCFFKTDLDLTHSHSPLFLPTKGKKVVTVHDLYFMDYPQEADREAGRVFAKKIQDSLDRADGIIAVSESTKRELLERFPVEKKKIKVIYHGLDLSFHLSVSPKEKDEARKKFSLPPDFILFVGSVEPRKNLSNLIEAFLLVRQKFPQIHLVIAGPPGKDSEPIQRKIRKNCLHPWVRITGYASTAELKALYSLASIFVFPSLCEGFGMPLLEAMASGTPLVVSGRSAVPEVVGNAGVYFNPHSPEEIAEKVGLLLEDSHLQQKLIKEGMRRIQHFDWKSAASETLNYYRSLIKE